MAVTNGYATFEQLDEYVASANNQISIGTENRRFVMEAAINAASRMIDRHCRRSFYDAGASARSFVVTRHDLLLIGDCHTITAVASDTTADGTFDEAWASSDYQSEPVNGVVDGVAGWPTTRLRAIGSHRFPIDTHGRARVQVTATWGWAAVPDEVFEACLIQAHRLMIRPKSPHGVLGMGDFGAVARLGSLDPDVKTLVGPFRRLGFA